MGKSSNTNKSKTRTDYAEYMSISRKLRERLVYGDVKLIAKENQVTEQTVQNTLNGFYYRDGIQMMYKNWDLLHAITTYLEKKELDSHRVTDKILAKLENL